MKKEKICWANTNSFDDSNIVIVGIPNETGSHSRRKGTSNAPNVIRKISNQMDVYMHKRTRSLAVPLNDTLMAKVYDYGNVQKRQIVQVFSKIATHSKIPIAIGGDHSNTTRIIRNMAKMKQKPLSLIYFDAHPDFIGSRGSYYGSVVFDLLDYIDTKSSMLIGIRSPESEEIDNINKHGLRVITPLDIIEKGTKQITNTILTTIKNDVYISLDMDSIDPAYAPGVSVPVPFGLQSQDVVYMIKKIIEGGVIGLDIMEVNPSYDLNDATSHLASRLIGEAIASCKI